ncbi:MAG: Asp-tRNA(Asn)/Glu-tRNA(Gln) amidotransferase subunit GatB [Candidatus Uhrbacteria bacterium]|nr:Asp-tRNA(Asn)/Glu-tRNA(Gln) amidotransferase subunit GatB [Candidatus Uhrbacteria bacterium]
MSNEHTIHYALRITQLMHFLPIIGLEIHVRLKTQSKMFCACPNVGEDAPPNTSLCPVCTGQPGALPALNAAAIKLGVRAGLALGCRIPTESHFDRKNYFYPDLPKGYQISQYDFPISLGGSIELDIPSTNEIRDMRYEIRNHIRIGITRAHLEEDAAKNIHDAKTNTTLVDFNRSGTPLLEIVTEPDFRSPLEAKTFLQELQMILRTIGASDADMERGFMRCDANISLLPVDEKNLPLQAEYNPKIEIKNLNSFKAVERGLAYEIKRQTELYQKNEKPQGATRGWNEHEEVTFEQRLKETNADYRYFPEPDLPPLFLKEIAESERAQLPELPAAKRLRLQEEHGFSTNDVNFLVANDGWADYAEKVMSELQEEKRETRNEKRAKLVSGWLTSKLAGLLAQKHLTINELKITAENFAEFIHLIDEGVIGSANAQKLLTLMVDTGTDPSHLLEEHNLGQHEDPKLIQETVKRLIKENPDQVAQVKAGKLGVIKWFVGGVMKVTEGRANPTKVEEEIRKQLGV